MVFGGQVDDLVGCEGVGEDFGAEFGGEREEGEGLVRSGRRGFVHVS